MDRSPIEIEFDSLEHAEAYVELAMKMVDSDIIAFCGREKNEEGEPWIVKLKRTIPSEVHQTIYSRACGKKQSTVRFTAEEFKGATFSGKAIAGPTPTDVGDFDWLDPDSDQQAPESKPIPKEKLPFYLQELIGKIHNATYGVEWDVVLFKALSDYKTALETQVRKEGAIFPLVLLNFEGYIAVLGMDLRPDVIRGLSSFIQKKINQGKLYEYAIVAEAIVEEDDEQLAEYLTVHRLRNDGQKKFITLLYSSPKMEQMEATEIYEEKRRTGKWKMLDVRPKNENLFFEKSILDLSYFTNLW